MTAKTDFRSAALALLGFCTLSIASPLLDTLGQGVTFFLAHGAKAGDVFLFALGVYLVPPALLLIPYYLLHRLSPSSARLFISATLGLLAGLWVLGLAKALPAVAAIPVAAMLGALVGWGYSQRAALRLFFQITGIISPIVLVFFVLFTPAKQILLPNDAVQADPGVARKTPVVMLILDELSLASLSTLSGDIDSGRLPNFARLAGISTWYQDTTTVSTQTEKAVPAILSGRHVAKGTQPIYSEFPQNLFSLLGPSHHIRAWETATRFCTPKYCAKSDKSVDTELNPLAMLRDAFIVWLHAITPRDMAEKYLPSIANSWRDFSRESDAKIKNGEKNWLAVMAFDMRTNQGKRFNEFIAEIRAGTGANLNYLHLALPHIPWTYLPNGTVYNGSFDPGQTTHVYGWSEDQHLVDQGALRYVLQVEYVDLLLGKLLDAIQASGRMDETLLIVVADHGVAFSPKELRRKPIASTLAEVSRVPLFIKYPQQTAGKKDTRKVETIDILPTITDVLDLPLPEGMDGQSLVAEDWHARTRRILEVEEDIADIEAAMDLSAASQRIYRVVKPGRSALESIAMRAREASAAMPVANPRDTAQTAMLQLDRGEWYASIDRSSGFLPARLTGKLAGAGIGTELIIGLNGKVAGSGFSYDELGRISIMLDPRLLRQGFNEVTAYMVHDDTLRSVAVVSQTDRWTVDRSKAGIVTVIDGDGDGSRYTGSEGVSGYVGFSRSRSGVVSIGGWAYDEKSRKAATVLLLVDGEHLISTSFRNVANPFAAIAAGIDQDLQYWFTLELSGENLRHRSSLTVIALFDGGRLLELRPGSTEN